MILALPCGFGQCQSQKALKTLQTETVKNSQLPGFLQPKHQTHSPRARQLIFVELGRRTENMRYPCHRIRVWSLESNQRWYLALPLCTETICLHWRWDYLYVWFVPNPKIDFWKKTDFRNIDITFSFNDWVNATKL